MKYEWEQEVTGALEQMQTLPNHLAAVAIAVVNTETGEAALVELAETGEEAGSVIEADYRKDILGDAQARYSEALAAMEGAWAERRIPS